MEIKSSKQEIKTVEHPKYIQFLKKLIKEEKEQKVIK